MNAHGSSLDESTHARGRPCASGPGRALSRLEPWLLLLLAENPAHGYELLEHLKALPEAPNADRGHLYRTLRRLEEQGLVTSTWQVPQAGAARHTYTLSADGLQALDAWAGRALAAAAVPRNASRRSRKPSSRASAARMWPAQASSACRPSADRVYVCRAAPA